MIEIYVGTSVENYVGMWSIYTHLDSHLDSRNRMGKIARERLFM